LIDPDAARIRRGSDTNLKRTRRYGRSANVRQQHPFENTKNELQKYRELHFDFDFDALTPRSSIRKNKAFLWLPADDVLEAPHGCWDDSLTLQMRLTQQYQ